MSRFDIHRCHNCGVNEFEDKMIEFNDKFYCGIRCKLTQERKQDESIGNLNVDRAQLRALGRSSEQ